MGIIIDIVVIALIALSIFLGYKKGLIGVVFNLCAFIVAIALTAILYVPVTNFVINNTEFDDTIKNSIIENGVLEKKEIDENDKSINTYIEQYVTNNVKDGVNSTVENTAGLVAEKVVTVGVAILLFIGIRIVLLLLKFIAEGLAELPIIKQFNKLGGTIYGIIRGIVFIYILLAICFFIVSVGNFGIVTDVIDSSILTKFLYTNNIILNIIF